MEERRFRAPLSSPPAQSLSSRARPGPGRRAGPSINHDYSCQRYSYARAHYAASPPSRTTATTKRGVGVSRRGTSERTRRLVGWIGPQRRSFICAPHPFLTGVTNEPSPSLRSFDKTIPIPISISRGSFSRSPAPPPSVWPLRDPASFA